MVVRVGAKLNGAALQAQDPGYQMYALFGASAQGVVLLVDT